MRYLSWPSLPLLGKELIEQSNRRRTFVIRTAYAILTYGFLFFVLWDLLGGLDANSLALLGRGREMFNKLVWLQFFAMYAFLPGLACGVLTSEKERDTLAMLLLTKLGPWTIIFEKLLSRLMPLGLLMWLSLPLLAVAYSLGGVEPPMILAAVWILISMAFQTGAIAVFCSAWFRTTAGAFIGTYAISFCLLILPSILVNTGVPPFRFLAEVVANIVYSGGVSGGSYHEVFFWVFGPYVFDMGLRRLNMPAGGFWSWFGFSFGLLIQTLPMWISAAAFLVAARVVLWRRAFVQPKRRVLEFFRWLDGLFHRLNQNRVTKGIVLINESTNLPYFEPISWRETKKKTLGTTRYLIRFLLVIEPPLLFFLLLADIQRNVGMGHELPGTIPIILLWIITALSITVLSTGLIAGEKAKQTLDVLLSTPLTTKEIIDQKLAGVKKLTFVLWIPLLTVLAFDLWWRGNVWSGGGGDGGIFLMERLLPMIVYPPLITWIGFHFGLRLRNQGQALLATIGVLAAWCLVPIVLQESFDGMKQLGHALYGNAGWAIFSPVIYVVDPLRREFWQQWGRNGMAYAQVDSQILAMVIHFGLCLVAWFLLRAWGYRSFARIVHRNEGNEPDQPAAAPAVA